MTWIAAWPAVSIHGDAAGGKSDLGGRGHTHDVGRDAGQAAARDRKPNPAVRLGERQPAERGLAALSV